MDISIPEEHTEEAGKKVSANPEAFQNPKSKI
jgi:hypothetical protein